MEDNEIPEEKLELALEEAKIRTNYSILERLLESLGYSAAMGLMGSNIAHFLVSSASTKGDPFSEVSIGIGLALLTFFATYPRKSYMEREFQENLEEAMKKYR